MPIAPNLDAFLARQFSNIGLQVPHFVQTPPETRALPRIRQQQFRRAAAQMPPPEQSWWEKVLDVLGSGEYAVASFARSLARGRDAKADPFSAFFNGLTAAFRDDNEYRTRMFDVLTEIGWKPKPGSTESYIKAGVGLLTGILADPLTYVTFGPAARATRIGGTTIREVLEGAGVRGAKAFAKGQALSKKGRKVAAAFRKNRVGAFDDLVSLEKATLGDVLRVVAPPELFPSVKAMKEVKDVKLVGEALEALGRKATPAAIDDFMREGYKELLDKGGLKWFGKAIIGSPEGYLTPRTSSLHGLILGHSIKTNLPLITKVGKKIKQSVAYQEIVAKPINSILRSLWLWKDVPTALKPHIGKLMSVPRQVGMWMDEVSDNYMSFPRQGVEKIPVGKAGLEVELMVGKGLKRLTGKQGQFVSRMLTAARARPGTAGKELTSFFQSAMHDTTHQFHKWAKELLPRGVSQQTERGMIFVAHRLQDLFQRVRQWEVGRGFGDAVVEEYFPRMYKNLRRTDLTDMQLKGLQARDPWWFEQSQTNVWDYDRVAAEAAAGNKYLPGPMVDDLKEIVESRLSVPMRHALSEDALQSIYNAAAKDPAIRKELLDLVGNRRFLARNPEAAMAIASVATKEGIDTGSMKAFRGLVADLRKVGSPERAREVMARFVKAGKLPENLSEENVEALLGIYRSAIQDRVDQIPAATPKVGQNLREIVDVMREGEEELAIQLNKKLLTNRMADVTHDLMQSALPYERPRPKPAVGYTGALARKGLKPQPIEAATVEGAQAAMRARTTSLATELKLPVAQRTRELQAGQRAAARIGRQAEAVGQYSTQFRALEAGKEVPGGLGGMWNRGQKTAGAIEGQLEDVEKSIAALSRLPQASPVKLAKAGRLLTEWESLVRLRKELPAGDFWEEGKRITALSDKLTEIKNIERLAEKAEVKKYLTALSYRFAGGKNQALHKMTLGNLKLIRQALEENPQPAAQAVRLLTPPAKDEVFREALISGKYKIQDAVTGELKPFRDVAVPEGLALEIDRLLSKQNRYQFGKIASSIDLLTKPFKRFVTSTMLPGVLRPAFFIRNLVDLAFRGGMGFGVRYFLPQEGFIKRFTDVSNILLGKKGSTVIDGVTTSYRKVREWLVEQDMFRRGFEKIDDISTAQTGTLLKKLNEGAYYSVRDVKNRINSAIDKSWMARGIRGLAPQRFGNTMENAAVVNAFLSSVQSGRPVEQTLTELRKFLFAYNALTPFESRVMRNIYPFYSFTRQAVPFLGWVALKRPGLINVFPRIQDMATLTEKQEASIPDWIRDYPYAHLQPTQKGFKILSMRNVFTIDVLPEILPKLSGEGIRKWLAQINPVLLAPVEMAFGKNLYLGRNFKERKTLWRGLETAALREGPIGQWLEARQVTLGGEKRVAVNGNRWHLLTKLYFSRLFREIDRGWSAYKGKLPQVEWTGLLTGFKAYEIDVDRYINTVQWEAERAHSQYNRALRIGDAKAAKQILEEYRLK